jgi:hypothetical protein
MRESLYIIILKSTEACASDEAHGFLDRNNALAYCDQHGLTQDAITEAIWSEDVRLSESDDRWRLILLPSHDASRPFVFFENSTAEKSHCNLFDPHTQRNMAIYFPRLWDAVHRESVEEENPVFIL